MYFSYNTFNGKKIRPTFLFFYFINDSIASGSFPYFVNKELCDKPFQKGFVWLFLQAFGGVFI